MENISITSAMVGKQLFIRYLAFNQQSTATYNVKNIQLEYGETCTNYVEYYTPIEYCKIGNYEDKIFKNIPAFSEYDSNLIDGAWYIKKNIGKVVLDGTQGNWFSYKVGTGYHTFGHSLSGIQSGNLVANRFISNYLNTVNATGEAMYSLANNFVYISIDDTRLTEISSNALNTWLSSNNVTVYYVMQNPTYTQITGTLETQLENVYQKLLSYTGTTNISQVNNDLSFVLNVQAIEG